MRDLITNEWFTILSIFGLALVVLAKVFNTARFNDFLLVIGNSKYLRIYSKDQKKIDVFNILLFINFSVCSCVFLFFVYTTFFTSLTFNSLVFLKAIVTFIIFFTFKLFCQRFIGNLFEIKPIISNYTFQKSTFKNYTGIVLWVINLLLIYIPSIQRYVVLVSLVIISALNILGFLISIKYHLKSIKINILYFLLYLCALEFGPYIILYKVLKEV